MSGSESEDSVEKVYEKRLFVGGLFPEVNEDELKSRFGRFGVVKGTEIKIRKDNNGNPTKTFAYIDLETNDKDFKKCVSTYNKTRWKGSELKIQVAKVDFMKKLEKEREESSEDGKLREIPDAPVSGIQSKLMAISDVATAANFNMRGAVPGTVIPGEEKWVVGKYGRVLPIVHMKRTVASKILKIDPSKLTHNLRKVKDEKYVDIVNPSQLTWQLEEYDNDISKKRKGEFPEWTPKVKRKRNINGELNNGDIQQRILDVVAKDKTYRNSDFEVVSVNGKTGGVPVSNRPSGSFNDVGDVEDDSDGNEDHMVESFENNIVDGFMDLSRFNSDSEEEMSKDAFRKVGLGQFNQSNKDKSSKKIQNQKGNIQVKSNIVKKSQQLTRPNLETSPKTKQNDVRMLPSQNIVDEYSNGLNDELNRGKDEIVESSDESNGHESDDESDVDDDDEEDGDEVDDDDEEDNSESDLESLVGEEMKNLKSAKPESSNKQTTSSTVSQNISEKTNLKPKVVEGKRALLAFRGTKYLTSDPNSKTDLTVSQESNDSVTVKVTAGNRTVSSAQNKINDLSKRKGQVKGKKEPVEINFEKSTMKRAGLKNLVNPKFLHNEFSSGLDMVEGSKSNASSGDDDDDESDFETFAKKEMAKIEAGNKQLGVIENSNLRQFDFEEGSVSNFQTGKSKEIKKGYYSSSDSEDSEISRPTNITIKSHQNVVQEYTNKPVLKNSPNKQEENDDEDDSDDDTDTSNDDDDDNGTVGDSDDDDDNSNDDDDDDDDDNNDVDEDDKSDSSSDFETLISKAVKEVHNVKHSNVTLTKLSNVPKASENVTKFVNKNELEESEHQDSSSMGSECSEESSEADDNSDIEMNDNNDKYSENSNNVSEIIKTNHNRNLDVNSLDVDDNSESSDDDDDDDVDDSNGDGDSDDESNNDNDDLKTANGNQNKMSQKGKKNQTLDFSGLMSESSDSDNDTLVESEPESSDESSSSNEGNVSVVNKSDAMLESINDRMKKDSNKNIDRDSSSDSEEEDSGDSESDDDTEMKDEGINRTQRDLHPTKTDIKPSPLTKNPVRTKDSVPKNVTVNDKEAISESSPLKRTINQQNSTLSASTLQKNSKTSFEGPIPIKKSSIQENKSPVKQPELENKADVDKKRLAALKQRQEEALAKKSLIKNALANLDASKTTVNTKIKFDSDSEDEHVAMETDEQIPMSKTVAKSKNLFDSDDDSDDDSDGDDDNDKNRFNIREEFEGAEGRKLAKLQSRFGNDERFRMDSRFIESGSEDEDDKKIVEEDETTRSLKILQSVVGIKAVSGITKQDKAKKKFKDVGALKYDPTREGHKQFEVETSPSKTAEQPKPVEKKKKKKGKKKEDIAMETEPAVVLPEVTKDKFYEISDSLKNTFVQKANAPSAVPSGGGGFSLLAAFGTHQNDDDVDDDDRRKYNQDCIIPIPDILRTNQLSLANRFNVRDDVDDDDNDEYNDNPDKKENENIDKMDSREQTTKPDPVCTRPLRFFFLPNDERLKESINRKKESSSQDDWATKRRHLIESYKSKHKNLRRKKGPMKKRGGKR